MSIDHEAAALYAAVHDCACDCGACTLARAYLDLREQVGRARTLLLECRDGLLRMDAENKQARAEVERLRRLLPEYDCRHSGGAYSDSGGIHCPPDAPCQRCRLGRADAEVERMRGLVIAAKGACWFDWSDNDPDAVQAINDLCAALAACEEVQG